MTFHTMISIVEACASLAAAVCWGTTVAVGSLLTRDLTPELKANRTQSIARWIVRASIFTAGASLSEAARDVYQLVT